MVAENLEWSNTGDNGSSVCVRATEKLSLDAARLQIECKPLVDKITGWLKERSDQHAEREGEKAGKEPINDGGFNPTPNILPELKIIGAEIDRYLTKKLGPDYSKKLLNFSASDEV